MRNLSTIRPRPRSLQSQGGVMLLEALVAILIFTVGVIAVMGMQAVSIQQVSQAKYRTDASYLANQIIGQMWVDQPNLAAYATAGGTPGRAAWDAVVASTLPAGSATITVATRLVTITINWRQPNETVTRKYVAVANINASLSP
jgi:type IV pilus assembly protein PilV